MPPGWKQTSPDQWFIQKGNRRFFWGQVTLLNLCSTYTQRRTGTKGAFRGSWALPKHMFLITFSGVSQAYSKESPEPWNTQVVWTVLFQEITNARNLLLSPPLKNEIFMLLIKQTMRIQGKRQEKTFWQIGVQAQSCWRHGLSGK